MVENYTSLYEKFKALKADVAPMDYVRILKIKKKICNLTRGSYTQLENLGLVNRLRVYGPIDEIV